MRQCFLSLILILMLLPGLEAAPRLELNTDRSDARYQPGETVTFTIRALDGDQELKHGKLVLILSRDGGEQFQKATVDLAAGTPPVMRGRLDRPGFLRLEAKLQENGRITARNVAGAACAPEQIRPVDNLPPDFKEFWTRARAAAAEQPLDPQLIPDPAHRRPGFRTYRVNFAAPGGRVYGFLSVPEGNGPFPALLSVPGAGWGEAGPEFRNGTVILTMNVHNYDNVDEPTRAQRFREQEQRLGRKPYYYEGADQGPEHFFYYRPLLGISRAAGWLAEQPYVRPGGIGYYGFSQGGAFGLMLTAITPEIREAVCHMPALCDHLAFLNARQPGWPQLLRNLQDTPALRKLAGYYDAVNFARLIHQPITVLVGFADTVCAPGSVYAAYNVIPSPRKRIIDEPLSQHGRGGAYWRAVQEMTARLNAGTTAAP